MAFVNSTARPSVRNTSLIDGLSAIGSFFSSLVEGFRRYRVYQDTFDALNRLSDAELRDLGMSRHEISRVAGEAAFLDK